MNITRLNFRDIAANTYVLGDEGEPAIAIDLGANPNGALERYIEKHHAGKLLALFLTHGHFDHIGGLRSLEKDPQMPIFLSAEDEAYLTDPTLNYSKGLIGEAVEIENVTTYALEDGDEIKIGNFIISVIATPYHTKGSLCFYLKDEGILFSGDSLFSRGIGRYDLKGAAPRLMRDSLRKLKALPPETRVFPGHGPSTTIGEELLRNADLIAA